MNKTEAKKIIASMLEIFSNYKPVNVDLAADIWADVMQEYTYEQVSVALKVYTKSGTSGFAPVPGQLIEIIQIMSRPKYLNETEAWALVSKALRNSGYNSVSEFSKLPPLVQKAVGLPDQLRVWALDENYNEEVVSSNFMRTYRSVIKQDAEISKMPVPVKALIEKANEGSASAEIEQKRQESIDRFRIKNKSERLLEIIGEEGTDMPESVRKRYKELFEGT